MRKRWDMRLPRPTNPAQDASKGAAEGRPSLEKRLTLGAVALLLFVLGSCAWLAAIQLREQQQQLGGAEPANREQADDVPTITGDPDPKDGLAHNLPDRIAGLRTVARQDVPGFEGRIAEAIYVPLDEELAIRMPLNSYVAIRVPEEGSPAEYVAAMRGEFPDASPLPEGVGLLGTKEAFLYGDDSRHVLVWASMSYVVMVDTRFTAAVPVESEGALELYGAAVARAVAAKMGR